MFFLISLDKNIISSNLLKIDPQIRIFNYLNIDIF